MSPAWAGVICDGVDDQLTTGQLGSVFFNTTATTISLWVKPTGAAPAVAHLYEGQSIFGDIDGGGGTYYGIYRHNNSGAGDEINCWNFVTSSFEVATTTDNDTWTHLAYVQNGTSLTCYKNGVSAGSNTSTTSIDLTNSGIVALCNVVSAGVTTVYAGEIADVRFFNTALTAAQVETIAKSRLYTTGAQGTAGFPLAQCADGAAATGVAFVDRTGNGATMTADDGANNTGMLCSGSSMLAWPVGAN
jgi:hypothetical protein